MTASIPLRDRRKVLRPGWTEILVGLAVLAAIVITVAAIAENAGLGLVALGLISGALSGIAAFGGFAAAAIVRIRSWAAFGVRRTSWRWVLAGIGAGVAAWLLSRVAVIGFLMLTGNTNDPQASYGAAASAGPLSLILSLVLLAVVTPIGEEFLFRGVVTTALMRYHAVIATVGSAIVFALAHGVNLVFPAALVVGLVNAELRRRSGSVWPGVIAHGVNNAIAMLVPLMIGTVG